MQEENQSIGRHSERVAKLDVTSAVCSAIISLSFYRLPYFSRQRQFDTIRPRAVHLLIRYTAPAFLLLVHVLLAVLNELLHSCFGFTIAYPFFESYCQ